MLKNIKKFILLTSSLLVLVITPVVALAADCTVDNYGICRTQQATGGLLPTTIGGAKNVPQLIGVFISIILGFLGIVFFLLVFYAGLVWMTARGDESKIEDSKKTIEAAIIGLVIIMAAYALTRFVFTSLGAGSGTNTPATSPAPIGCCVNRTDASKCTANRLEANCSADETWASGACPSGCTQGPPGP
jgi:hypothetical protein